ncbi:immunoglobulin A1 protease autotransporter isoform X2 [Tribolium castaneum]|uniref:immunoglobulin A1 protease autotransporter isoform X2 n=1 Tax=Tribolium castaneum TaxID=7070 RepID=UPI00077DCE88|nr:PREDICTED: immunoglobulin A1 protease autotransporter isoform X2 [Tribolium castaneum]|eukprot:XP_015836384.1 PREDICTED: immunoglobulin A1 protease autotransporter isoform X2 [Tribolium castaneum]
MWKNIKIDEDFTLNVHEADEQQTKANICLKKEELSGVVSDFLPNYSVKKEPQVIDLTDDDLSEVKKEPICEINLTNDEDLVDAKIEIKAPVIERSELDVIVIPDDTEPEINNKTSENTSVGREIVKQIINSVIHNENVEKTVPDPVTRPAITVRSPDVINCLKETVETRLAPPPTSGETQPALQVPVIAPNTSVKKTNGEIVGDALRSLLTAQSPEEQETIGKLLKNLLSEDQVAPSGGSLVRNVTSSSSEFQTPPKKTPIRPKKNNSKNPNKKTKSVQKIVMTPTGVKIADPQILFLNGQKDTKRTSDFFVRSNSKRSLDSQLKEKKNESPVKKQRTESLHSLPTTSPKSKTTNWVQDHFNVGEKPAKRGRKPKAQPKTRGRKPRNQPAQTPKTPSRRPRKQPETPVIPETVPNAINDTCKIIGEFLNGVFNPDSVQGETLPSFLGRCYGTQLVNMYLSLNGKKQSGP